MKKTITTIAIVAIIFIATNTFGQVLPPPTPPPPPPGVPFGAVEILLGGLGAYAYKKYKGKN